MCSRSVAIRVTAAILLLPAPVTIRAQEAPVFSAAQASNAVIYTIALVDPGARDANPSLLRDLAQASGGEYFRPNDARAIAAALGQIARSIRQTYTIAYTPTNTAHDGAFRRIRVVVTAEPRRPLVVRSRAGYLAGTAQIQGPAPQ